MIFTRYAIRHWPTGNYLLTDHRGNTMGITHREPMPVDKEAGPRMPALYRSEKHAKNVLRQWLRGMHFREEGGSVDVEKKLNRIGSDMEIVPVELNFEATL